MSGSETEQTLSDLVRERAIALDLEVDDPDRLIWEQQSLIDDYETTGDLDCIDRAIESYVQAC